LRIVFFIESLRSGGKERRLLELLKGLSCSSEYDLLLVLTCNEIYYREIFALDIQIKVIERKYLHKDLRLFFLFYKLCKKFNPDIIHTWGNMPSFYAIPTSIILHRPILNSQITDCFPLKRQLSFFYLSHRINFHFSKIITSNSYTGIEMYKPNKAKSKVIYNGVSLNRFVLDRSSHVIKKELQIDPRFKNLLVMVGSFSRNKNFDLLLDVAKAYNEVSRESLFICVGDGENFQSIQKRLIDEEINNVSLLGSRRNVEEILSICKVGLLFSPNGEGLSNALIEYCASGIPVIVSNIGGNKEIVQDGVNGFLLEEDNVSNVIDRLDYLLKNDRLRNQMGENAKNIVMKELNINVMLRRFQNLYSELLES